MTTATRRPTFAPGFRISFPDMIVLCGGAIAIAVLFSYQAGLAFAVGFVIGHFFLFCNVFRIARVPELLWAALFVLLASGTILVQRPGGILTSVISLCVSFVLIAMEMRKPSYHGVEWKWINPNLPAWWRSHVEQ